MINVHACYGQNIIRSLGTLTCFACHHCCRLFHLLYPIKRSPNIKIILSQKRKFVEQSILDLFDFFRNLLG